MPDMPTEKRALLDTIDHLFAQMKEIASAIFSEPELGYQEFKSSARLADFLEANGFAVERGLLDMPTAFHAAAGSGLGPPNTTPCPCSGTPADTTCSAWPLRLRALPCPARSPAELSMYSARLPRRVMSGMRAARFP